MSAEIKTTPVVVSTNRGDVVLQRVVDSEDITNDRSSGSESNPEDTSSQEKS